MDQRELTHFNAQGRARMVDVSDKPATKRKAVAVSTVRMAPETLARIRQGGVEKGDVLAVAQVAGILAAKKTPELVPMCHPLPLTGIDIRFAFPDDRTLRIEAEVTTTAPTGVEMEALTAASVAALTVYDMCKALDKAMVIGRRTSWKSGAAKAAISCGTRLRTRSGDETWPRPWNNKNSTRDPALADDVQPWPQGLCYVFVTRQMKRVLS